MKKFINCIIIVFAVSTFFLTGCASKPSAIGSDSVSSSMYSNWDCDQVNAEMRRLTQEISSLEGKQTEIYKKDQLYGWAGFFLIWPAWFFIDGDGQVATDLSLAKGTFKTMGQLQIEKKCGM
jgi:hypothetical protein